MPRLALAAALCAAQTQVQVTVPDAIRPQGTAAYGDPEKVELSSIAFDAGLYQRRHVITRGRLDMLEPPLYYVIADGGARVLLLLGEAGVGGGLEGLVGGWVEVRGIVRRIRPKEYVGPAGTDLDLIEDPLLPVLPPPSRSRPRVSLTSLALSDAGDAPGRQASAGEVSLADLVAEPARHAGRKVHVVGRFRGRNLYDDLPQATQRDSADWVLLDGAAAVWVCGKPPRGKGWALDPGYKADTARWLEVSGRIEVVGNVVYLRASKLALTKAPARTAQDSTP